jgi:hypothetical protein
VNTNDTRKAALLGEVMMATTESLLTLAEYLEISLDNGGSVLVMQMCDGLCAIYVGDATKAQDHWRYHGAISASIVDDILRLTRCGRNHLEIGGQKYRFIRSAAHFEDRGATVFATG